MSTKIAFLKIDQLFNDRYQKLKYITKLNHQKLILNINGRWYVILVAVSIKMPLNLINVQV